MKKQIITLFTWMALLPLTSSAQVLNGDFEGWNSQTYSIPLGWDCSNGEGVSGSGITPVTQVIGLTNSAVRMETILSGSDTLQAYITIGDPMGGQGGFPCSQMPTAITGYWRYSIPGNDSAILFVTFKSGGTTINTDIFKIKGTGTQNTFVPFYLPLTLSSMPDSVIIAIASSNLIDQVGIEPGSFIEIDELTFSGASVLIPNNSFDNWNTASIDNIVGWVTNGNVTRTTDSHTGTYAVQLVTIDWGNGSVEASHMTNGQQSPQGYFGGIPYSSMNDTIIGYYKYAASGPDSASVGVSLFSNGNQIGGSGIYLPPAATFTYFEIPVNSLSTPDTLRIDISSSKYPTSPSSVGSTLIIDDMALKSQLSTGVQKTENSGTLTFAFPNPATDIVNIKWNNKSDKNLSVKIFDLAGRNIQCNNISGSNGELRFNISALNAGIYFYTLSAGNDTQRGTFTKN